MNENLRECLNEAVSTLQQFEEMHTVGETADDAELDLIKSSASELTEASEIVRGLDDMRVNGRRRDSVRLELGRQAEELRGSAKLMAEYQTERSDEVKMPTAYDTVITTMEWLEDFLDQ